MCEPGEPRVSARCVGPRGVAAALMREVVLAGLPGGLGLSGWLPAGQQPGLAAAASLELIRGLNRRAIWTFGYGSERAA
eukprot:SAG11_NODE_14692_length_603_cov_0.720238_1_plen_79_part_00